MAPRGVHDPIPRAVTVYHTRHEALCSCNEARILVWGDCPGSPRWAQSTHRAWCGTGGVRGRKVVQRTDTGRSEHAVLLGWKTEDETTSLGAQAGSKS